MEIRKIESQNTLELRLEILRPNGSLKDCVFPGDDDLSTRHFGAFIDQLLVGIVSIYKRSNSEFEGVGFQLRAMATRSQARGKGVGSELLKEAELYAFENGADYIWANARDSAKGFYLKSDYSIHGDQFHIENIGLHVVFYKDVDTNRK